MLSTVENIPNGNSNIYNFLNSSTIQEANTNQLDKVWNTFKPLNIRNEDAVVAIVQWLGQSKFLSKIDYKLIPAVLYQEHAFSGQHNVVLTFALADKYASHFILLRGLFEFGKKHGITISSDRATKTFSIEVLSNQSTAILNYFETIFNWLAKEVHFKASLKEIIKFEDRVRAERTLVYRHLKLAI